jgi:hypothetical protein
VFLLEKIEKSIEKGKMSFMLKRYLDGKFELENLTPHTRDSEVLYIITLCEFLLSESASALTDVEYKKLSGSALNALNYIKTISTDKLILGADWRDVREDLNNKPVLTNACLLYKAYSMVYKKEESLEIKKILNEKYYNGTYFVDYPGSDSFDILGNALAILYDIADSTQTENILNYVKSITTKFGVKMCETFLPPLNDEEDCIMIRDKAVVWPFVNGFMLLAMIHHAKKTQSIDIEKSDIDKKEKEKENWHDFAKIQFENWICLDGFYEWYDIVNGKGYGSPNQIWSAALFLRVYKALYG